MLKTDNLQLNKPERDDRVLVNDFNENSDEVDKQVGILQAQMKTKAPVDSPKFFGRVLVPKVGLNSFYAETISNITYEQPVSLGVLGEALTVEEI